MTPGSVVSHNLFTQKKESAPGQLQEPVRLYSVTEIYHFSTTDSVLQLCISSQWAVLTMDLTLTHVCGHLHNVIYFHNKSNPNIWPNLNENQPTTEF